ncbi:response regulator transcription factor [Nonlabens mediterrranea]|uniref:Response regulator transcription factor n=1 Tax=Nonlabens mediterrranea TaxID=1419947 RepID=A0ABS0A991_9FLAO|nr:two component system response regulator [Flavobacteria bacterium BBFL7]MBF4985373.1 response regulator transcription factor [Nonlabens mediterrranea]
MINEKINILLAEDEPALGLIVKESLETRGYEVNHCHNGIEAYQSFEQQTPDIAVLDVMMPELDGFSLAKKIRTVNEQMPIIFLTAKSQTEDVLEGFHVGGNDYLKKPFSMEELIVRIKNLLSRQQTQQTAASYELGKYNFNFPQQKLSFSTENPVKLTHREAHLLYHLIQKKNQVLDRTFILKKLWGNDDFFSGRSMDVFISKLRKKLSRDSQIEIINVRGYGYKLIAP